MLASCQPTGITDWASSPARPKLIVLIAPSAKTNGARRRIAPFHSVPIQLKKRTPSGTASAIAQNMPK